MTKNDPPRAFFSPEYGGDSRRALPAMQILGEHACRTVPWGQLISGGTCCLYSSIAKGQRVLNLQPDGGLVGLGTSPIMTGALRCPSATGSTSGAEASNICE